MSSSAIPWRRPLDGRDPDEEHRVSTPLELLFDLSFVVAVSAAAAGLHRAVGDGHIGHGLATYAMVFFAIWWAWVNYSWFASAYDSGDIVFRLMTFVIMAGVLVLAAAIPGVQGLHPDFTLLAVGYVIMRSALVPMWLRVARDQPTVRPTALRYAGGVAGIQVLWIARLQLHSSTAGYVGFVILALLEMSVPWFAERNRERTPWHAEHIAERYELFTIIVLGEVILATSQAISASRTAHAFSANLFLVVIGGLLLVLCLWWLYFKRAMVESLSEQTAFFFGYAHFLVFGSVAAVGAALAATVDVVQADAHLTHTRAIVMLAGAVTTYLLALGSIHAVGDRDLTVMRGPVVVSVLVFAAGLLGVSVTHHIGPGVLMIGLALCAAVAEHQLSASALVAGEQRVERHGDEQ